MRTVCGAAARRLVKVDLPEAILTHTKCRVGVENGWLEVECMVARWFLLEIKPARRLMQQSRPAGGFCNVIPLLSHPEFNGGNNRCKEGQGGWHGLTMP